MNQTHEMKQITCVRKDKQLILLVGCVSSHDLCECKQTESEPKEMIRFNLPFLVVEFSIA